ncbi:DUF4381 domain-containing protein [Microbulbifer thermotolerans]|uniref:DUF4381 domain-containing protein n=1 Tax=Microbulbifer thermotolerans TaxID=252514 RepID=A0A143HMA6_MICTH|nr:DUF4381 domain-containing protein [Microbulbifer thermotolerans]AMX02661.1 hypothetical protein A3224_08745 [Microbulbifer thermotolerans]MCX2794482.1 DUF4381 domain-containing protein [Microbulbifer thermotolerans]WKT59070.1 DUF4381 domain-containing protein [Microbulbifer thermotolerans]
MRFTAAILLLTFGCGIASGGVLAQQQPLQPQLSPEAQELLAQLRDIHEPAPVGWWPPAPGWWLLALLLLTCAGAAFLWLRHKRRQRRKNRYRAEAIKLLRGIDIKQARATQDINEILKRVAVTHYGRGVCGNLTGRKWLEFLQTRVAIGCPEEVQKILLEDLYRESSINISGNQAFLDYAVDWVQRHGQRNANGGNLTAMEAENV